MTIAVDWDLKLNNAHFWMYMYDVLNYFLQHAKQRGRDKESVEEEAAHLKDSVSDLTEENHELKKKM